METAPKGAVSTRLMAGCANIVGTVLESFHPPSGVEIGETVADQLVLHRPMGLVKTASVGIFGGPHLVRWGPKKNPHSYEPSPPEDLGVPPRPPTPSCFAGRGWGRAGPAVFYIGP